MLAVLSGKNSGFYSLWDVVSLILIFVFVILLAYFATKVVAKYQSNMVYNKNNIRIIESFRVDSTKLILIVQIAGEYYALAYSRDNVTLIDKLNPDEINNLKAENSSKSNNKLDFKEILSQIRNKNSKDDSDIK
ncbi:MAG: flagellar biosynthetic protein FliO [Lachnospiraceae bacterium]|nr:flagellar biosynthetic protein FliO [Lachnospiraceae bacterium]